MAATAAGLNHLISFPKKVQVHFGQNNLDEHPIFPSDGFKNEIKAELKNLGIEISSTTITFPQKQGEVQ